MKNVNVELSDESYKIIVNYKIDYGLKTLDDALDKFIRERAKAKI